MAAPMLSVEVDKFVNENSDSSVDNIVNCITKAEFSLLDLVDVLGRHLTSEKTEHRANGTRLLAEVLHMLNDHFLSANEVSVIEAFFCDRLKDHHSVIPHVLHALTALCRFENLTADGATHLLQTVFREVHAQSQTQADRQRIYEIIAALLGHQRAALHAMGGDFIYGFIQMVDNEKDPRNLLLAFECTAVIAKDFPLGPFAEELFDVVASYFPVEYRPPRDAPYHIEKEDLASRLQACLCASPEFAPFCLPLLLEKLISSVLTAKMDALRTLICCTEVYSVASIAEFSGSFWSSIRKEVYSAMNDDLVETALTALTAMTARLSSEEGKHKADLDEFVDAVFRDTLRYLREPEQKMIGPSSTFLLAVAVGSRSACQKVIDKVIPMLLQQFNVLRQTKGKVNVLQVLLKLIKISGQILGVEQDERPLAGRGEDIFYVFASLPMSDSSDLRCLGATGLHQLLDWLTGEQRRLVATHLITLLLADTHDEVRKSAIAGLTSMSSRLPDVIRTEVVPKLTERLAEETSDEEEDKMAAKGHVTATFLLQTVASLSTNLQTFRITLPVFHNHVKRLQKMSPSADVVTETCATWQCLAMAVVSVASSTAVKTVLPSSTAYFLRSSVLTPAVQFLVIAAASSSSSDDVATDASVVTATCAVIRTVTRHLDVTEATDLTTSITSLFLDEDLTAFDIPADRNDATFAPLKGDSSSRQTRLIELFTAVICAVRKQVEIARVDEIVGRLVDVASHCSDSLSRIAACKCSAGLLNKMAAGVALDDLLERTQSAVRSLVDDASLSEEHRHRGVTLWAWLARAMTLKGHRHQAQLSNKLLQWLAHPELSAAAAAAFAIVLSDTPDVLTAEMHAEVGVLYRQRFFLMSLPVLVEGFHNAGQAEKSNHLVALSSLLRSVPKQVLLSELPPLMPLLVRSLHCHEVALWLSTLTSLADLAVEMPSVTVSHVDDIIPHLLRLARYKPSMAVRVSALRCLAKFADLPSTAVLPHSGSITRLLAPSLDDHKRLVRREAVLARNCWFMIGSSGS